VGGSGESEQAAAYQGCPHGDAGDGGGGISARPGPRKRELWQFSPFATSVSEGGACDLARSEFVVGQHANSGCSQHGSRSPVAPVWSFRRSVPRVAALLDDPERRLRTCENGIADLRIRRSGFRFRPISDSRCWLADVPFWQ